jgi:hypothetical protein
MLDELSPWRLRSLGASINLLNMFLEHSHDKTIAESIGLAVRDVAVEFRPRRDSPRHLPPSLNGSPDLTPDHIEYRRAARLPPPVQIKVKHTVADAMERPIPQHRSGH